MKEAELLFSEIFNCDRASLYLNKNLRLDKNKALFASSVLKRRLLGEPLQYILGKTEFMGLEFKVTPCVFIPRPETELLVEKVIELVTRVQGHRGASLKILDIGTGSGCIAVSLAKLVPQAKIDAVDISEKTLAVARENAELNKVKVNFFQSDLFTTYDLPCLPAGRRLTTYDIIVSNPPYVVASEINSLQAEVRQEPRLALDGGRDGLDFYRRIIATAWRYLRKGGFLVLEIGFGQKEAIKNIFQKSAKFEIIEITKDYNNIDRIVVTKLKQDVRKNG